MQSYARTMKNTPGRISAQSNSVTESNKPKPEMNQLLHRSRWWKAWTVTWQVALLWVLSVVGNWVAARTHCPVPGSILAFAALFLLLQFKVVKIEWVSAGADWLLANLLLWFIPAAVGIVKYGHLVQTDGIRLILVIGVSITLVMSITGIVTDQIARRFASLSAKRAIAATAEVDS